MRGGPPPAAPSNIRPEPATVSDMLLADLNPKLTETGYLVFDCPCGGADCTTRIRVPLHPTHDALGQTWAHTGQLERLTVSPAVGIGHWHGRIIGGEVF